MSLRAADIVKNKIAVLSLSLMLTLGLAPDSGARQASVPLKTHVTFEEVSPKVCTTLVDKGRAAGKPVTLCGELASQPIGALALIAIGYRALSLSAASVGPVKAMVLDLDAGKAAALVNPMLESPTGSVAIRDRLEAFAAEAGLQI